MELCLIDGQVQRVYKNLWPSLREFWLWAAAEHRDTTYVVTEKILDEGQHLVACANCSEVVWVGYELAEDHEHGQ